MYAETRTLRIVERPDEAHFGQLARRAVHKFPEIEKYCEQHEQRHAEVARL